jgi:hypothetical protein
MLCWIAAVIVTRYHQVHSWIGLSEYTILSGFRGLAGAVRQSVQGSKGEIAGICRTTYLGVPDLPIAVPNSPHPCATSRGRVRVRSCGDVACGVARARVRIPSGTLVAYYAVL